MYLHLKEGVLFVIAYVVIVTRLSGQVFNEVPSQIMNYHTYVPKIATYLDTTEIFLISDFVTYGDYKLYLADIEEDSSEAYYISQRPDSSIAPNAAVYSRYVNSTDFDDDPVLGVSWNSIVNYCNWRTKKDNKDSVSFFYRMPSIDEWITAYHFFEQSGKEHDLNQRYADWTMDSYYDNYFDFKEDLSLITFFYTKKEIRRTNSSAWNRGHFIGNSYLYSEPSILFYAFWGFYNEGYRHVSFRLVKESIKKGAILRPDKQEFIDNLLNRDD